MLTVRRLTASDMAAVTAIVVAGLQDYFTSDVPGRVEQDAAAHGGWILNHGDDVAAFAATARRPPAAAEIVWIAVDPAPRGRGLGIALLARALESSPPMGST